MINLTKSPNLHKPTRPGIHPGLRVLIASNHPAELFAAFNVPASTLTALGSMVRG